MTQLMSDPVDRWVDLTVQKPRQPLLDEMHQAYQEALDTEEPFRRAYYIGVGTGYAVGFGFITREVLDRARRVPAAVTLAEFNLWKPNHYADEETAWACGVLYGYWMGTSELPDARQCEHCGTRLLDGLDDIQECEHGEFCFDCQPDWHTNLRFAPGPRDICVYESERAA
jgi:hypothetical protein